MSRNAMSFPNMILSFHFIVVIYQKPDVQTKYFQYEYTICYSKAIILSATYEYAGVSFVIVEIHTCNCIYKRSMSHTIYSASHITKHKALQP